jgi:hypothetical protein
VNTEILAEEEHLVHDPPLADRHIDAALSQPPTAPDLGGQQWPERLDPVENGAV